MTPKVYAGNPYTEKIRIKKERLDWLKKHKPLQIKSAASFLDEIIESYKKSIKK